MVSSCPMFYSLPVTDDELKELLIHAAASLGNLSARARSVAELEDPVSLGFCPRQMRVLCATLEKGRQRVQLRIPGPMKPAGADGESQENRHLSAPAAFLAEYRRCCRRLCRALNLARTLSDSATVTVLSELVLRLEKQLWLLDTPQHDPGTDRYRSVSLFLTC